MGGRERIKRETLEGRKRGTGEGGGAGNCFLRNEPSCPDDSEGSQQRAVLSSQRNTVLLGKLLEQWGALLSPELNRTD